MLVAFPGQAEKDKLAAESGGRGGGSIENTRILPFTPLAPFAPMATESPRPDNATAAPT